MVHHGGRSTEFPDLKYNGGYVSYIDKVNSDLFSVIILNDMIVCLGYSDEDIVTYHFKVPEEESLDLGLRPLGIDSNVLNLIEYAESSKVIEVYVERLETYPREVSQDQGQVTQESTLVEGSDESDEGSDESDEGSDESDEGSDTSESDGSDTRGKDREDDDDPDYIVDKNNIVDEVVVDDMELFRATVVHEDEQVPTEYVENEDEQVPTEDVENEIDDDTPLQLVIRHIRKKKNKCQYSLDSPFYVGQAFYDKESMADLVKAHVVHTRRQLHIQKNDLSRCRVVCMGGNLDIGACLDKAVGDGSCASNTTHGGPSVSKGNLGKRHKRTKKVGGELNSGPKPRTKYPQPKCQWLLHISRKTDKGAWCVKTYKKDHDCLQTRDVNLCTVGWLAKQIEGTIRTNPGIPITSLQEDLVKKYQIELSFNQIFRAKTMATKKIQGDFEEQYKILRDYCEELLRVDPKSTVKVDVEHEFNPTSKTRQFKRIYICLGALKMGFKAGIRDLLGVDGCFLKGPFPGQILSAVAPDGNSGIYPVAYALVEAENKDSWTWFFQLLGQDLGLNASSNFTFVSDRQKGLIHAIDLVFPAAEHRHCLRHIHDNMKGTWKGDLYKNLLYGVSTATIVQAYEKAMQKVLAESKELHDWMLKNEPKHWCRAFFSGNNFTIVALLNCRKTLQNLIGLI
ncbi:putative transposase, mutator type, MULE transposase domain-containing protein [Helianthus annuus]|nr:putative transposase, mutator type, MULE transposase domain-containing protein [Helianthus annuus]